jgi:hypothetical protein
VPMAWVVLQIFSKFIIPLKSISSKF